MSLVKRETQKYKETPFHSQLKLKTDKSEDGEQLECSNTDGENVKMNSHFTELSHNFLKS